MCCVKNVKTLLWFAAVVVITAGCISISFAMSGNDSDAFAQTTSRISLDRALLFNPFTLETETASVDSGDEVDEFDQIDPFVMETTLNTKGDKGPPTPRIPQRPAWRSPERPPWF